MKTRSFAKKIFYFPLTKILLGAVVVIGSVALVQFAADKCLTFLEVPYQANRLVVGLLTALMALSSYSLLYRFYEKRKITELSTTGIFKFLAGGALLGALLQSLTILVIFFYGGFTVLAVNPLTYLLPALVMAITSSIFEEILVRGIIFRIMEEKLGSYLALFISALIFGALHLGNPNSSAIAALGLAVQAGFFLAAAYIYTRNLWFPIAIHFAWNFTQGGIFGAAVSGNAMGQSLLTTKIEGAEWYTGGPFGPEGSVQATVFCSVATVVLLILSHRRNNIIKPFWSNPAPNIT